MKYQTTLSVRYWLKIVSAGQVYNNSVMWWSLSWARSSCVFLHSKFFFWGKMKFFLLIKVNWFVFGLKNSKSSKTFHNTGSSCTLLLLVRLEPELHRLASCFQPRRSICPLEPEKNICTVASDTLSVLTFSCFSPWSPSAGPQLPSWTARHMRSSSSCSSPASCRWPGTSRWGRTWPPRWCWICSFLLRLPAPPFWSSLWQHRWWHLWKEVFGLVANINADEANTF